MKSKSNRPAAQAVTPLALQDAEWAVELLGGTLRVIDEHGDDVALVGDVRTPRVRQLADFLSAAPKLYVALAALVRGLPGTSDFDYSAPAALKAAVDAGFAALAKAEGRSAAKAAPSLASDPAPSEGAAPHATERGEG